MKLYKLTFSAERKDKGTSVNVTATFDFAYRMVNRLAELVTEWECYANPTITVETVEVEE